MFENFGKLFIDKEIKEYTSFGIGGVCDYILFPNSESDLIKAIKLAKEKNIPVSIFGNLSNVLVRDKGIRGLVIILKDGPLNEIKLNECEITAGSGATLKDVADFALKKSLTGLEFSHGIPGSVGGAMVMNAGAYDGEMKDVVKSVRLLTKDFEIIEVSNEDMDFSYRHSRVIPNGEIVLSATFSLKSGNKNEIEEKMNDFDERRASKQPLELKSCGSTFKRPAGYFAGKLIDDSGLRGFRYKNCGVSEKHCGFVVNYGDSTAEDVLHAIDVIRRVVYDKFGVSLETELKVIGEMWWK